MSLKILKNKGVPFNNGILLFDYYIQLNQTNLFNFKFYQDKNTSRIKYISTCNDIIYKTDDNYLNIYNISFNEFEEFDSSSSKSAEFMMRINLLFINLVIDYIKNITSSDNTRQTMYINLYNFINNSITSSGSIINSITSSGNNTTNYDDISNTNVTGDNTNTNYTTTTTTKEPLILTQNNNDIVIPFIENRTIVNGKYKYVPVLLSETGRGTFTDWDFLKELHNLDNFALFEKYKPSLDEYNTFFDINLELFNINTSKDLKKSYNENTFIYSSNLDESFNRVIETDVIKLYSDDVEIDGFDNITLRSNTLKVIMPFNLPQDSVFNSFDLEYTIYDNAFNKLDEHFEVIFIIETNQIQLEIKNIKETFYQEEFYININKFNVYYNKDTELVKLENYSNINSSITIINNPNSQDDINFIIIQPEDLKTISYLYDEKLHLLDDNATVFLSFDVLDSNITNIDTNTILIKSFFDSSKISIDNLYNGKEIELNYINNSITTNLVLPITFPINNTFSTELNFVGSSNSRVFILNNTTLFFDIQLKEYQKTNLYGFVLPCGLSYMNSRKYYVGYNRKNNQLEQFESYDSKDTFNKLLCYSDEILDSDKTLDEFITQCNFKLSENFNSSLWNDFYLLYKDKKISTIVPL